MAPTGNQRIIIPLLLTFPSPTHTPVRRSETFHWNIPRSVSIGGGGRFTGGVDPSAGEQCPPPIFADVFPTFFFFCQNFHFEALEVR